MSDTNCDCDWIECLSFPFSWFTPPVFINEYEFIICPQNTKNRESDGIYKYNIRDNLWSKIIDYPSNMIVRARTAAFDAKHNSLFVSYTGDHTFFELELDSLKINVLKHTNFFGHNTRIIQIDNKLHHIGSRWGNKIMFHHVWDTMDNNLRYFSDKKEHKLHSSATNGLGRHGLIYLNSKKSIFLFGGRIAFGTNCSDDIYQFSCFDEKWNKLNIKMPMKLQSFGIVKSRSERFIIILGGISNKQKSSNIYIYDVRDGIFSKSKIEIPECGKCHAVITNNKEDDEKICFGFIRNCYKMNDFNCLQELPFYLIKFISKWICLQEIYLLHHNSGNHWKINIDHILQNAF